MKVLGNEKTSSKIISAKAETAEIKLRTFLGVDSYTTAPCRPTSKPTHAAVSDQLQIVPHDHR